MEQQDHQLQRGRSPSQGQGAHISHTPSPSPQPHYDTAGIDPALAVFATSAQLEPSQYLSSVQPSPFLQSSPGLAPLDGPPLFSPSGSSTTPDPFGTANSFPDNSFPDLFPGDAVWFSPRQPSTLDPNLWEQHPEHQQQQQLSVNPNDLMSRMSSQSAPTPPHLLPTMNNQHSPSPHASPNLNQGGFPSPGRHSRNPSLEPPAFNSGGFNQTEWSNICGGSGLNGFRRHHRAPSETFSTYSDVEARRQSPWLPTADNFDDAQPSPLLNPQADPQLFHDPTMQLGRFTLSETHISPNPSPHISPRLGPQQQSLPHFQPESFGIENSNNQNENIPNIYQSEPFPSLHSEMGQAGVMTPPEINIDFAPPSRQASFEPAKVENPNPHDALSPPDRSRGRFRNRARSDPFSGGGARSPSIDQMLSPSNFKSRSPSPAGNRSQQYPYSRRSSTSSVPNRDYILDLADPSRPSPSEGGTKRTQKHPATFQCSLCPKRFTRAYNLRSHLRTHTDERPFVCSVCGKAFARQHDRKRHEGLHSGEKKFICRGDLKEGKFWGCGRRFARADALGRHFRSEAGRVCIRPLLEEEAQEKGSGVWDQQSSSNLAAMPQQDFGGMQQQPQQAYPQMAAQPFLPAALLAQYPALATMNWDQVPAGDEIEDLAGRSDFDASSGGEMFDDDNDYKGSFGTATAGNGWVSDSYDGR